MCRLTELLSQCMNDLMAMNDGRCGMCRRYLPTSIAMWKPVDTDQLRAIWVCDDCRELMEAWGWIDKM